MPDQRGKNGMPSTRHDFLLSSTKFQRAQRMDLPSLRSGKLTVNRDLFVHRSASDEDHLRADEARRNERRRNPLDARLAPQLEVGKFDFRNDSRCLVNQRRFVVPYSVKKSLLNFVYNVDRAFASLGGAPPQETISSELGKHHDSNAVATFLGHVLDKIQPQHIEKARAHADRLNAADDGKEQ